jgi:tRNA threonylcarbamoyladenosine biosynthesis protein TsaB
MLLTIDTSDNINIKLSLLDVSGQVLNFSFPAARKQSEMLLPAIEKILKKEGIRLKDIKELKVINGGSSFTSLRIGVVAANALAFALGVPVSDQDGQYLEKDAISLVQPKYDREPEIGC